MIIFGRKRKRREAEAERAFAEAYKKFENEQTWRTPGWTYKPLRQALRSDGPQRTSLQIRVDEAAWTKDPTTGTGWHGRVERQGPQRSRQNVLFDRLIDNPLIKVYYKDGNVSFKVDKVRINGLRDTAKLYIEDPRLVVRKVKNRAARKIAERERLLDAALFV